MAQILQMTQFVPASPEKVWSFFSSPRNLDRITPPGLKFQITHLDSDEMFEGQMIHYRIRIAPFVWQTWVTEITRVRERELFVDEQRVGPYRLWHHEHRFEAKDGGTEMTDTIHYHVGLGPVGWLAERLFVNRQVASIFDYRRRAIESIHHD